MTRRLIVETRGNPLALLELAGEPDRGSEVRVLPAQLHLTAHVEQTFLDRSRRLPQPVQSVVLLAAADDTGDLDVLRHASAGLGVEGRPGGRLDSGLLVGDTTSFSVRHPLVRSAVYQAATGEDRRRAHRALADALAGSGNTDREAWHRAFAAEGPDPEVVIALELVGTRALRRGGYVAALAAYERATALSPDPAQRAALTVAAARSAWACGQAGKAQVLLSAAREDAIDPLLICDIARLRGHIEVNLGSATEGQIFVEAAHAVHPYDPAGPWRSVVAAAVMRTYGADSGTPLPSADLRGGGRQRLTPDALSPTCWSP